MNNLDKIVIKVHKIAENGTVVYSSRFEIDPNMKEPVSSTYLSPEKRFESDEERLKCLKLNDDEEGVMPISGKLVLNIPTMIRCQNCETNFPTKYQYQRHQCEFNADKVVFKTEFDHSDKDVRVKYVCSICEKQFVSKNNLDRHQSSHESTQENICEHCNKHFVSENRLRIHKENHCKKAGDISKFYRSDVTVWKCKKCHEVFSSPVTANYHVTICSEVVLETREPAEEIDVQDRENEKDAVTDKRVEKMLTEILLQCEFCNRTYADKNLLLMHQKKHTTSKNYECVNCSQVFDSYTAASQHWMKKCSEYVSLFYLPKLTYCEYCDRTFKSHELLYTHKIKKKHYTSKVHEANFEEEPISALKEKYIDNKEILNKLIEDVLKTLDVPVEKIAIARNSTNDENVERNLDIEGNPMIEISEIKTENEDMECIENISDVVEKKKRGRRRKWSRSQNGGAKKTCSEVNQGFKFQCERCVKVFDNTGDLETHREKEHASSFSCEECGQVLHSAKSLLIHSRAHKSLKPYVCETCGRSYSQTSHLWQHMRFHQGIKPFACPHEGCEARYTIRPDLKDHIRKVHTRERPFKCNVCDKCFLTGSVYYQHRLIHTNDRRYACDLCPKRFFRADALNNHRRIHTDERPYPCHVCGREFRQKGDRNKHLRTQHPDSFLV
ncbi:uncharacterized protein isoform X2 [Leptinotarsa decemlineata]|uniref:uncharacterized protein isoform X2 n=1 Tax=Leptinotarsa decemlineata TaxID=7539 RepID=UPI003D30C138